MSRIRWFVVPSMLLAFATPPAGAQPRPLDQCLAVCRAKSQPCRIDDEIATVDPVRPRKVEACTTRKVLSGPLRIRYKHNGKWFDSPSELRDEQTFRQVTALFPPDACSLPDPRCLQLQMAAKRAPVGGHGVDGHKSDPAGVGEPCSLGLPCGRVTLPGERWSIVLADRSLNGIWKLRILRGTPPAGAPAEFDLAVEGGRVLADGARFTPGAVYSYTLDSGGRSIAAGEFSLLARAMMAVLRKGVDERIAKDQSPAEAWIDVLAANDLDWDAWQALQRGD